MLKKIRKIFKSKKFQNAFLLFLLVRFLIIISIIDYLKKLDNMSLSISFASKCFLFEMGLLLFILFFNIVIYIGNDR